MISDFNNKRAKKNYFFINENFKKHTFMLRPNVLITELAINLKLNNRFNKNPSCVF